MNPAWWLLLPISVIVSALIGLWKTAELAKKISRHDEEET